MAELEYYEQVYYGGQVEGRGLIAEEQLRARFNILARMYDEMIGPLLPHSSDVRCMDLACGYGNFLFYLRKKGYTNYTGVDLDPKQVALAQSLGLPAQIGDALTALGNDQEFDLISAIDLIEHLDRNAAVRLLQLAYRALKPNGMLILKCPCADGFTGAHDVYNDLTHRWGATSGMLAQLLRTVGFEQVQIIDMSLPAYPATLKRKVLYTIRRSLRLLIAAAGRVAGVFMPKVWSTSQLAVARKTI